MCHEFALVREIASQGITKEHKAIHKPGRRAIDEQEKTSLQITHVITSLIVWVNEHKPQFRGN